MTIEARICKECGTEYDNWRDAALNDDCDSRAVPPECDCYKCTEPKYNTVNGVRMVQNNMEWHTHGQPCSECGTPRTKKLDLGRKGRFVCPECR